MPYQDAIALILKIIDYHNNQAMKDFSNAEFHKKQSMALKLWLIDMKEFIKIKKKWIENGLKMDCFLGVFGQKVRLNGLDLYTSLCINPNQPTNQTNY